MWTRLAGKLLLLAVFMGFVMIRGASALPPTLDTGTWYADLDVARKQAMAEDRILMVYLHNRHARHCQQMEEETLGDATVKASLQKMVPVALNIEENLSLGKEYNLIKVPTIIWMGSDGEELDRAVGFKTPLELDLYMNRLIAYKSGEGTLDSRAIDITEPRPNTEEITLSMHLPNAAQMDVVGDFNDWTTMNPMTRDSNGDWSITIYLRPGIYEYKFLDEKGKFYIDEDNPDRRASQNTGNINSVLLIGEAKNSPVINGRTVTFILYRPEAKEIQLGGTFNDWTLLTMFRNPRDPAMWGVKYDLEPGEYQYKYVIDGEWMPDPENYRPVLDGDVVNSSFVVE